MFLSRVTACCLFLCIIGFFCARSQISNVAKAKSGELLEFIVLDGEGEDRGKLMSEIIGQGIDSTRGLTLIYV